MGGGGGGGALPLMQRVSCQNISRFAFTICVVWFIFKATAKMVVEPGTCAEACVHLKIKRLPSRTAGCISTGASGQTVNI